MSRAMLFQAFVIGPRKLLSWGIYVKDRIIKMAVHYHLPRRTATRPYVEDRMDKRCVNGVTSSDDERFLG